MTNRLHIAHFTNTYHPVVSGVVRSISTFRQSLSQLGHNAFVFAQQADGYEDSEPFIFRYPAVDLPLSVDFPLTIPLSSFIDRVLPHLKLDVIHSHHPFLLGQTAVRKAESLALPLVFTFHTRYRDYSHYVALSQDIVKEAIARWLGEYMQKCHHVVTPSQSIKQMLLDDYGIAEQISVVPTGIDLKPYEQADGQAVRRERGWGQDKVIISIGRLAKEKNWELLLEGAAQAIKNSSGVRLVIIGDGVDRADLEDYAAELGIAEKVEFTGEIPFEEVPAYLSAADIFCFASLTETQGLVTMEAIAARLPVAAVDASGTKDVIEDGQEGFLTKNESAALGQALERLLGDDELRGRFKEAAWQRAQSFEMKRQAEKLVAVYEQAREDQQAAHFVTVDKDKRIFSLIDDEQWARLLGLDGG